MNSSFARIFALWGGPLAWFILVCAGYALASWSCFPQQIRRLTPAIGYDWTTSALVAVTAAAFVTAVAAYFVARQIYYSNRKVGEAHRGLVATATERACFLALWGMMFAAGSAVAVAATGLSLILLPRCAG